MFKERLPRNYLRLAGSLFVAATVAACAGQKSEEQSGEQLQPSPVVRETPTPWWSAPPLTEKERQKIFSPEQIVLGGGKVVIHNIGKFYGIDFGRYNWGRQSSYSPPLCTWLKDKEQVLAQLEDLIERYPQDKKLEIFFYDERVRDRVPPELSSRDEYFRKGFGFYYGREVGDTLQVHFGLRAARLDTTTGYLGYGLSFATRVTNIIGYYLMGAHNLVLKEGENRIKLPEDFAKRDQAPDELKKISWPPLLFVCVGSG